MNDVIFVFWKNMAVELTTARYGHGLLDCIM